MWTSCGLQCVRCPPFIVLVRPSARYFHSVLIRRKYFGQSLHFCSTFFLFFFQISCQLFFVFLCARQPNLVSASNLVKGTLWSFWSVVLRSGPSPPSPILRTCRLMFHFGLPLFRRISLGPACLVASADTKRIIIKDTLSAYKYRYGMLVFCQSGGL